MDRLVEPNCSVGKMENLIGLNRSDLKVGLNRFGWQNGKSGFTAPGSTIGSNPVKIVRTGSNRFVASPTVWQAVDLIESTIKSTFW